MLFRPVRGSLNEAMENVADLAPTRAAIAAHTNAPEHTISVEPYCFDKRINWQTYLVTSNGNTIGFTNGPVKQ